MFDSVNGRMLNSASQYVSCLLFCFVIVTQGLFSWEWMILLCIVSLDVVALERFMVAVNLTLGECEFHVSLL